MFDIFKAVAYLHSQDPPIIHRDIKPENILFCGDKMKLADFGWSNMKTKVRTTFCGTPDYLAPEMILERGHNEKLDVWTLGVLTYELLVGKAPFRPGALKSQKAANRELEKNIIQRVPNFPKNVSKEAVNLVMALLQKNAKNRPSCEECLYHAWFRNRGLILDRESKKKYQILIFKFKEAAEFKVLLRLIQARTNLF